MQEARSDSGFDDSWIVFLTCMNAKPPWEVPTRISSTGCSVSQRMKSSEPVDGQFQGSWAVFSARILTASQAATLFWYSIPPEAAEPPAESPLSADMTHDSGPCQKGFQWNAIHTGLFALDKIGAGPHDYTGRLLRPWNGEMPHHEDRLPTSPGGFHERFFD